MVSEEVLLGVLKRWNLWDKELDAGLPRPYYVNDILKFIDRKEVVVLKGIRRCGKSTIMKQVMLSLAKKNNISKKQILYLNLEDYNLSESLDIPLFDLTLKVYRKNININKKTYFFIDEIQFIEGWEKWVRTKYDLGENIKFLVSGSCASLISQDFSALLTGRNISFPIKPLSFTEFLAFKNEPKYKNRLLDEYLEYGGFPEVVLESRKDLKLKLLQQYFEDIIHKDIIDRYEIRNPKQVILLAKYLSANPGQKISYNKLSKSFGISKNAVINYVKYMLDAYLFFEVTFFSYSLKTRHDVTKLSKIFVSDNGFINISNIHFSGDFGKKYENIVFIKLNESSDEISYWSNRNEVDFISKEKAINVVSSGKIPERECMGLKEAKLNLKSIKSLILITKTKTGRKGDVMLIRLGDFLIGA